MAFSLKNDAIQCTVASFHERKGKTLSMANVIRDSLVALKMLSSLLKRSAVK